MTLGPLEYLVVSFEGNHFTGEILPELRSVCERGIIRIVDLFFIKKDEQSNITVLDLSNLSKEEAKPYEFLSGNILGLLAPEDIDQVASNIPPNSSVALLLFEHTWAIGLKEAIKKAQGTALAGGLVAPDVLDLVEEDLEATKQGTTEQEKANV